MLPIWGHDEGVAAWVATQIPGCSRGFGACRAMGVIDDQLRLVAGVVFHEWNPEAGVMELSAASITRRWLTPAVLWEMFNYPFNGVGCQMVALRVSERNRQWNQRGLHRMLKSYGFEQLRIPRLYGRDHAGILFTLTDDAWTSNGFHKGKHDGQV